MDEGVRSVGSSGVLVKNRNSSGCLIVRKKPDGMSGGGGGSSSSRKVFESKKEKKRSRLMMSDSGSSDELLMPRRKVGPETIRVCNGVDRGNVEGSRMVAKMERLEHARRNEDGVAGTNFLDESGGRKTNLEVFEFNEYDGRDGQTMRRNRFGDGVIGVEFRDRSYLGSMHAPRTGIKREFESGSSRHLVDKRKNSYPDRTSSLVRGGDHINRGRHEMSGDGAQLPILRDKFMGVTDEPIRVQGKNGVLKVMAKKKNNVPGPQGTYIFPKSEEHRKAPRSEDILKKNAVIPPFFAEPKVPEKPVSAVKTERNHVNLRKSLPPMNSKSSDWDSEDSDTSLKLVPKSDEAFKPMRRAGSKVEDAPSMGKTPPNRIKEGNKLKRGSGTEKQKLRERIREMLLNAGWTIDYRPRRNRDYLDAVYINPSGTAYWSIIKAYDALQKQVNEENEARRIGDSSSLAPITDDVLSQLTRKTRKKMEKEMKRKQRADSDSEKAKVGRMKKFRSAKHDSESMDSLSYEEKLSSYLKQGGKSSKGRMYDNDLDSIVQSSSHHLHGAVEKASSGSSSHVPHGRKTRKLGRCTLLVRSSNKGLNSESDGFVPYTGKRTLLSWLIDTGTVQLSQKVQYMNRRRTKVMLEGWITRDGVHCGCCSKILTVSKFEIHAGSKLRQPFQNICLESGVSLLQCQIDAWNRKENIERIGFHSVQVDGDDPDDDTCGLCGDGGDLICCDGCPSTFHLNCLNIKMLPPADWHCPNCTCKICGIAENVAEEDDATVSALLTCSLCGKKCHKLCSREMDANPAESNSLGSSFCGQKCRELFENLQRCLGVKHELEAGFTWCLVKRTDVDKGFPLRVECNSKLAVALTVMDECFLPIVDRRSGINLIHNVLYNSGSNFNRLNFSGFYAAILERGDEIISAASIRLHGTKFAEMPFIGTRHIYRRQGMCRRLFCAIESALCSLKVEKLVIPAIAELRHTWTGVFGFIPVEESFKQEMRSMNMLVFPGIDMLQKLLVDQENEENMTGVKNLEGIGKDFIQPGGGGKFDTRSPASIDPHGIDEAGQQGNDAVDEAADVNSGLRCLGVSLNDSPVMSGSLDASEELKNLDSTGRSTSSDSPSGDQLAGSISDRKCAPNTSDEALEVGTKSVLEFPVDDMQCKSKCHVASPNNTFVLSGGSLNDSCEPNIQNSIRGTPSVDFDSGAKLVEDGSEAKSQSRPDTVCEALDMAAVEDNVLPTSRCSDALNNMPMLSGDSLEASHVSTHVLAKGTTSSNSDSVAKLATCTSEEKPRYTIHGPLEMANETRLDSPVEDNIQSTSQRHGSLLNDTSMLSSDSLYDASLGFKKLGPNQGNDSGAELIDCTSDVKQKSPSDTRGQDLEMENQPVGGIPIEDNIQSTSNFPDASLKDTSVLTSDSGAELIDYVSDVKRKSPSDTRDHPLEMENQPVGDATVEDNIHSTSQCPDPSLKGPSILTSDSGAELSKSTSDVKHKSPSDTRDQALEMENQPVGDIPIEDNIHSTSQCPDPSLKGPSILTSDSGAELSKSTSDVKHKSPSDTRDQALEMENLPEGDIPVEDNIQSTAHCLEASLKDSSMLTSGSLNAFHELNIQPSNSIVSDSCPDAKVAEYAPDADCQSPPVSSDDKLVESNPVNGSSLKDYSSKSFKESDSNDSLEENVETTSLEPILSLGETIAENIEEVNGKLESIAENADGVIRRPDSSFCVTEKESMALEVVSHTMQCAKSIPKAPSDSSTADSGKDKTGFV